MTLINLLKKLEEQEITLGIMASPCTGFTIVKHNNLFSKLDPAINEQLPEGMVVDLEYKHEVLEEYVPIEELEERLSYHMNNTTTN